jgi:glycine betaine/proline transport system substrate-binding protein
VFAYYFAPTSIAGAYDWHVLEEPPYNAECWAEVKKGQEDANYTPKEACAYETVEVLKGVHKTFESTKPAALVELTKKMTLTTDQLNKTAAWAVEEDIQGKWELAALYYLRTYEDTWKEWVPDDIFQKVKAAVGVSN